MRRLPHPGGTIAKHSGLLRWDPDPAAPIITAVHITGAAAHPAASVIETLADDDPVYATRVTARVTAADRRTVDLEFDVRDHGIVTPRYARKVGDGPKPRLVRISPPGP
jgi:hypothetical protein